VATGKICGSAGGTIPKAASLIYGIVCYLIFLVTFLYAIGFVGDLLVLKTIDSGPQVPWGKALAVDLLLLGLFAIPHSVMARPGFKRWWTRFVPPPVERSTYVLVSSMLLALLYWQWRPISGSLWEVHPLWAVSALWGLFAAGWLIVLISTFLIDHFDPFGLRQVFLHAAGKPYSPVRFRAPALYRIVRHPIMLGFIIAFWATPVMSWGHLLFAVMTTAYIFVGVRLEEHDLRAVFGACYDQYRQRVSMLVPWISNRSKPRIEAHGRLLA
jgi:protein-S-isoprenylcysteine O-methyltransferase Ste14